MKMASNLLKKSILTTIVVLDLVEIHSITVFGEDGSAIIITSQYLRNINRYKIKETAKLSKMMSHCKKYSKRWFRLRRAKHKLLNKTNNQIRYFNHKITRAFVNWAVAHNISKVYVGDVEVVECNTRKKKHIYGDGIKVVVLRRELLSYIYMVIRISNE